MLRAGHLGDSRCAAPNFLLSSNPFITIPLLVMKRRLTPLVFIIALFLGVGSAQAQRTPGALGAGGQIGSPSGVTIKVYNPNSISYDFLAAWNREDFLFLNAHGLYERPIALENVSGIEYFFGPGVFVGVQDLGEGGEEDVTFGVSARGGVNIPLIDRFEIYAQLTPRISLSPSTEGDLGVGVGVRYYF